VPKGDHTVINSSAMPMIPVTKLDEPQKAPCRFFGTPFKQSSINRTEVAKGHTCLSDHPVDQRLVLRNLSIKLTKSVSLFTKAVSLFC
jgi:hypothetical protein